MTRRVPVTFVPAGTTVWVESGSTVLEAARCAGLILPAPCGGRGVCASCGVRVVSGELEVPDEHEQAGLSRAPDGVRLACRARVKGPCEIRPLVATARVSGAIEEAADRALVAGIDLGTTSVAALLVDASTGREVARASVPNQQQSFGADVLTRLSAALGGAAVELREAAEASIVSAIESAASLAGVRVGGVGAVAVAGNSAMIALLMGADARSLATAPFTPPSIGGDLPAESLLRRKVAASATCFAIPPVAGFVGGDALAASLAAGLADTHEPLLLVDFGTNAEILLAGCGPLIVASAAAGPAFEGAGVSCGGPAADGAVTRVVVGPDGAVELSALGSDAPRWFSGSGIVSAIAELTRFGHIGRDGLLMQEGPLSPRFSTDGGVLSVSLGDSAECLSVSQLDVRTVQLAKAAVRVGIGAVLAEARISASELSGVLVAGAFGSAMSSDDLVDLGIVPRETASVLASVGNAALEGAAMIAMDPALLVVGETIVSDARHVDLATQPGFAAALMAATELSSYSISR